jgi:hypothetical protein
MNDDAFNLLTVRAENSVLRGMLYQTVQVLKAYQDAPRFEIDDDGIPMLEVIVTPSLPEKAAEALERAERMLKEPERGRTR